MSKQNEMMAQALKEYMQMRADDIEEVVDALWVNQPDNLKAMKEYDDIEEVKQYYDTSGVLSKEEMDRVVAEIKTICKYKGETK
mgnify:CR=1 FL=1